MFEAVARADGDPILADMVGQVKEVYRCGKRPKCRWYGVMEEKGWLYGSMGLHWCTHPQPTTDYYALSFEKARVPGIS